MYVEVWGWGIQGGVYIGKKGVFYTYVTEKYLFLTNKKNGLV